MSTKADVIVYSAGLVACSVCALATLDPNEIERQVNKQRPTGIEFPWRIDVGAKFATDEPNPCPCNTDPETRRHWLLTC